MSNKLLILAAVAASVGLIVAASNAPKCGAGEKGVAIGDVFEIEGCFPQSDETAGSYLTK
jgi:hypothetical protein